MPWSPPLLAVLAASALFSQGARPIDTGRTPAKMLRAATCGQCHQQHYADWQQSRHAKAWTNGLFVRDYRRTPRQWCRNCHAPLAAQQRALSSTVPADSSFVDEGVGCAACHVRDGKIYARTRRRGSPHRTVESADFGSASFCAGCHQFNFPAFDVAGALQHYTDEPMQDTVAQFLLRAQQQGQRPKGDCRACHSSGATGHRFPGSHDPAMLDRALALSVCRDDRGAVVATVDNVGAGHNVPTGDVHRHLAVKIWRSTAPEGLHQGFFGRRFGLRADGTKVTTWDSTIAPGARRRFRVHPRYLKGDANEPINIELRYVYSTDENASHPRGAPAFRTVERIRRRANEVAPCR